MFRQKLINLYLEKGFDRDEAVSEVDFVIEIIADVSSKDQLMGKAIESKYENKIINAVHERLETRRPIQQILGQAYFMGERFFVNEYTLIPRPETEILVLECLKLIGGNKETKILDIGTGTGCLPISITKRASGVKTVAVDICEKALETAKKNAKFHKVEDKIEFVNSDIFTNVSGKFNIIISNPPYIPITEKSNLQIEVRDFEPENALFAYDEHGVEFYKKIIEGAKDYLLKGGHLLFELGICQSELVKDLMLKNNFSEINIIKDLDGIDRVIIARFSID